MRQAMKIFTGRKMLAMLLLTMLALNLSHCGQKGGLTRPDQTTFAVAGF
jgi:predicted small lipoprotein YifL